MKNQFLESQAPSGLTDQEIRDGLARQLEAAGELKKVLIVPPDVTRLNSYAGPIVKMLWDLLPETQVDVLPALGTHVPMTDEELETMFHGVPLDRFLVHDWRTGNVRLGEVPAAFVSEISEGLLTEAIPVEINQLIMDPSYDLIISVGQVVPHEVVGMANYNKNLFVGCGGKEIINYSHYLGALYGLERMMGHGDTPVRKVLNYAQDHYLQDVKLLYVLTVTTTDEDDVISVHSLSMGRDVEVFDHAVEISQEHNIFYFDEPIKKCVVWLRPDEFRTTWLGNKAVYRTRMAMADNGELIIIGPGIQGFGEDKEVDALIRKYGYVGYKKVHDLVEENEDLAAALGAAAHLIHGSSEDRFTITYAPGQLSREEVEGVNFSYMDYEEAVAIYHPETLKDGWNDIDGEAVYYISNPALGLWSERSRFG